MGQRGRPRHPDILTPREWEVLALLREGCTNDEIAARLGVALSTARFHVAEILGKLGVSSRADAARWRPDDRTPPHRRFVLAPLALLRRTATLGTGARIAAGGVMALAFAGLALLVWGVMATGGSGGSASEDSARNPATWTIDGADYGAPSVIAFNLSSRTATRLPMRAPVGYAEWAGQDAFIARSGTADQWGPWQLIGTDGTIRREIAPADASVDANADGRHAVVVAGGSASILDLTNGEPQATGPSDVSDAQFSPDGTRIAYRYVNGSDEENVIHDFVNIMVAPCASLDNPRDDECSSSNAISFQREADGFLNIGLAAWSPDGQSLLLSRQAGCETEAPGCTKRVVFEVYGTVLTGDVHWHDYEGELSSAEWAGPGRLLVTFAGDARDPAYPTAQQLFVTLGGAKHTIPNLVRTSCCVPISFSPNGRYAVALTGADAGERCALFDTQTPPATPNPGEPPGFGWTELAAIHPVAADATTGFCSYVMWSADSTRAIVSRTGN